MTHPRQKAAESVVSVSAQPLISLTLPIQSSHHSPFMALSSSPLPFLSFPSLPSTDLPHLLSLPSTSRPCSPLRASRRSPKYPQQDAVVVVPAARPWIAGDDHHSADAGGDEDDEEDDDQSLDLLVRFIHNVFRKASRRARKAVRAVLPPSIPTKLVNFSVDGALVLGFLWVLKAFLEVVCTLGSTVYVSILLIHGIWSGVSYIKENHYYYTNRTGDENITWNGTQAAT